VTKGGQHIFRAAKVSFTANKNSLLRKALTLVLIGFIPYLKNGFSACEDS